MSRPRGVVRRRSAPFAAVVAILLLLGLGLPLLASGQAAREPLKVRFGRVGPSLGMARGYVAEAKNLFEKRGVTVEVTEFRSGPELNTAVASGAVDVGLSGFTSVLVSRSRNLPIKAFFVETSTPFYYILAGRHLQSLADAVAKRATVGVNGVGGIDYHVIRYIVKRSGLDPEQLKYVQAGTPGQRTAALEAGRVDVVLSAIPEKYAVLRRGKVKELGRMSDYAKNFVLEVLWGREDYIAGNQDALGRFLGAMDDAALWIRTNPREAHEFLAKWMGMTYPEAVEDMRQALLEIHYPTVAEHRTTLEALLAGADLLAQAALDGGQAKGENAKAVVQQAFDLRHVR